MRPALVVLGLLLAGCGRDTATGTGPAGGPGRVANATGAGHAVAVTDDELLAFARWQRDYMDLFRRHWEELHAAGGDDPSASMRDPKAFEAKVAAVAARQAPIMKAQMDRVPLKGEQAELVTEAIGGIFHFDRTHRLVVARDDVRLHAARRRFGTKAVDDIVAREALILDAVAADAVAADAPVADAGAAGDVPSPSELDAYVSGAGTVRLGMTEREVTEALGRKPSRRKDGGDTADVAWDDLPGPRPGHALGNFRDDRLYSIEFAPAAQAYPRLDHATADAVTRADYVRRSVARTLRMADIEAVTRVPGYRASWTVMSGLGTPTRVRSRWFWEVDPGNRVLYVEEFDGLAGQPVIRTKR